MDIIEIARFHGEILQFLLAWRKKTPSFNFILRKSDLNKRLSNGYWFHGNDTYIALSFWTGTDWQSKLPNISFIIIPQTGECFLQISVKDSIEKMEIILTHFRRGLDLVEVNKAVYVAFVSVIDMSNYLETIELFLNNEKIIIDNIIKKAKKDLDTKQNPKNRIGFISDEEFDKNLKKIKRYQKSESSKYLPYSLCKIEIENYGLIKSVIIDDIPADAQWIFFTGENGSGKTTILKAIATAITNKAHSSIANNYSIGLILYKNGRISKKHRIRKDLFTTRKPEVRSRGFVCFGPVRLNVQKKNFAISPDARKTVYQTFERPHIQLFNPISPLIDIGYVYNRNLEISKELKDNQEKLKFIIEVITGICDKIVDITFGKGMRYYEVDGDRKVIDEAGTSFENLASGYKSIIAMISHMMLHLYYQQPEINDPSLLEGIVIIDEIDLHFHPKMQRDLVIKLSEVFPRIQFIASTHSPIPLLGVPENTPIFTSKIDSKNGVVIERMNKKGEISNLLPNTMLTSPIFDLQEIIPQSNTSEELLNTEDNYTDVVFNRMLDEKLASIKDKYTGV